MHSSPFSQALKNRFHKYKSTWISILQFAEYCDLSHSLHTIKQMLSMFIFISRNGKISKRQHHCVAQLNCLWVMPPFMRTLSTVCFSTYLKLSVLLSNLKYYDVLLQLLLKISHLYSHGYHKNHFDGMRLVNSFIFHMHLWPTSKKTLMEKLTKRGNMW